MDNKIIDTLRKRFPTAKIMPDLLVEAQHSTVRIFEVKYAEDYEFEDWQSWGLGGYYSYSANLSTGRMANGRVQCYWGDGETPTIVNLNIETATTENPIVEYSDEAVSGLLWRLYAKSRSLSHPIKTAVRSPLAAYS